MSLLDPTLFVLCQRSQHWSEAARDPEYVGYATANMTGANRLLLGVGWASLVFILWARTRGAQRRIELDRSQSLELKYLFLATAYAFLIPLKGTLSVVDTVVFLYLFGLYVRRLLRAPVEPPHLVGPAAVIATLGTGARSRSRCSPTRRSASCWRPSRSRNL